MSPKTEVILRLLVSMRRHIELVRPLQRETLAQMMSDTLRWYGLLRSLQLLVEHVVDVGNHLLAGTNHIVTDDARTTLLTLGEVGIVPPDYARRIAPMAGFRNAIVHEYMDVDAEIVFGVLMSGLADFEAFVGYIYAYMRRQGYLSGNEPTQ